MDVTIPARMCRPGQCSRVATGVHDNGRHGANNSEMGKKRGVSNVGRWSRTLTWAQITGNTNQNRGVNHQKRTIELEN